MTKLSLLDPIETTSDEALRIKEDAVAHSLSGGAYRAAVQYAALLTDERFSWFAVGSLIPENPDDEQGCAEALLAQHLGLDNEAASMPPPIYAWLNPYEDPCAFGYE